MTMGIREVRDRQAGISMPELLIAAVFSIVVLGLSGYFFLSNLRRYHEIRDAVAMRVDLKRSMQAMTRQISNAGGWLSDPRSHFDAKPDRFTFAYFDVEAKYCPAPDTLKVSFYANQGGEVIEEHRCKSGAHRTRVLAAAPRGGGLDLRFTYLDAHDAVTADPAAIKALRLDLALSTNKAGGLADRSQSLEIKMVNL